MWREQVSSFEPQRKGLRQGCDVSPFLFSVI